MAAERKMKIVTKELGSSIDFEVLKNLVESLPEGKDFSVYNNTYQEYGEWYENLSLEYEIMETQEEADEREEKERVNKLIRIEMYVSQIAKSEIELAKLKKEIIL